MKPVRPLSDRLKTRGVLPFLAGAFGPGSAALVLLACVCAPSAFAANKSFTGPGNFSDPTKWGGALPGANDTLRINGICTNDHAAANLAYGTIEVGWTAAGSLVWPVGGTNTLRVTGIVASRAGGTIDTSNGGTISIGNNKFTTYSLSAMAVVGWLGRPDAGARAGERPQASVFQDCVG